MHEEIKGSRERRRRRLEGKISGRNEIRMTLENAEQSIKSHVAQGSGHLTRKDTFTVLKSKSGIEVSSEGEQFEWKKTDRSADDSSEVKNITYSISNTSEDTYNVNDHEKARDSNEFRPVPAPRKRLKNIEGEKPFSDTDKDVTEIDLDDLLLKSPKQRMKPQENGDTPPQPVPKPRKSITTSDKESEKTRSESANHELPLIDNLQEESKDLNPKKGKFLGEKKSRKKGKSLVRLMRMEKNKIPRISAILKDLKDEENEARMDDAEDKLGFQLEPPHYPESEQNGKIYVQSKRGFYLVERDELFRKESKMENDGNGGKMEDSTVKTAILFQTYWSRSMIYFHGILAGFAFGHAATVTAIMMLYNYEPQPFIGVYSCLSLKIHYVFYALTALCIVSCFDRLDIGHINRKHLQIAWKAPSMWMVLFFYVISFGLTFSNQKAEARFDYFAIVNHTKEWWSNDEQVSLLQWYHTVWARNILVLFAWLLISLTKFPDFLHVHLNNMVKYAEVKTESVNLRRMTRQKTEKS